MKTMMTRLITATVLCALPAAAGAATLIVDQGTLMGANGVIVSGKSYDVRFAEGNCASVYDRCESKSFDFVTEAGAIAAAQALLDQVFTDTDAGRFDSRPNDVMGCGDVSGCTTLIRFSPAGIVAWNNVAEARNNAIGDDVARGAHSFGTTDTSRSTSTNFARFTLSATTPTTPVSAVPEPATWALMLAGFGMTGAAMRRRRRTVARVLA